MIKIEFERYSTMSLKEIEPNVCYVGGLCKPAERRKCEIQKRCLFQLCGNEEREIAKVPAFKDYKVGDKTYNKIIKAVEKWREEMFKKCKKVVFKISR